MRIASILLMLLCFSNINNDTAVCQEANDATDTTTQTQKEQQEQDKERLPENLLPIQLISHDGNTYLYQGDCCINDAAGNKSHKGLIVSASDLTTLTCPDSSPGDFLKAENITLPPEFGTTPTNIKLPLAISSDFKTEIQRYPIAEFDSDASNQFKDYYGNDLLNTSVRVKDKNGNRRCFTLMKMSVEVNVNGQFETRSFPVLSIPRETQAFEQRINGADVLILPRMRIHPVLAYPIDVADIKEPQVTVVTINVPDPKDRPVNKDIQCLLIDRPH